MTGEIPAELGSLTHLLSLRLDTNKLTGEIPAEFGQLSNLKHLWLYENELTGEIPEELGRLSNLLNLYVTSNRLTGEIPVELGSLASLRNLHLDSNQLSGGIPPSRGNLSNLEWLYLGSNQLSGEIPEELARLSSLQNFYLSYNQLSGEIPEELGRLSNLQVLDFNGNQLSGEIPARLGNLINLRYLGLSQNELTGEIPRKLGSLSNLESLILSQNRLTGPIPGVLGNLSKLKALWLSQNRLTGEIPGELSNLTNLYQLYLSQNQLSRCILQDLRDIRHHDLHDLNLPFCDVLLSGISISSGELTLPFDPYQVEYAALVGPPEATLVLTNEHGAKINYLDRDGIGREGAVGTLKLAVPLDAEVTPVRIEVVSSDEQATNAYIIHMIWTGAPGPPTISKVKVAPGGWYLNVSWTPPTEPGFDDITSYDLRYIKGSAADKSDASWTVVKDVWTAGAGGDLEHNIFGLSSGIGCDVQVRAVIGVGTGPWSATKTGTPHLPSVCVIWGAVKDPTNTGLVSDCEALLVAGDILAGSGSLNWSANVPMEEWKGVRIEGTPLHVHELLLEQSGLTGTIPPELGRLTR